MKYHYAITGTISYYGLFPKQVKVLKSDDSGANGPTNPEPKISLGDGALIGLPFKFSGWKDPPHMALANLGVDPGAAVWFTRIYGVLAPNYKGEAMSISVRDILQFSELLRRAWRADEFPEFLYDGDFPTARLWVRSAGMEIVIKDLWTLIRVMFLRDRLDGGAKICACPDCPAPHFIAFRKGQKYCSQRCAVLVNVRRFREREAKEERPKSRRSFQRSKNAKAKKA